MSVADTLKTLSGCVRSRTITSKAEVRQGVVLPLLQELGWPIFDMNVVRPSLRINGDSVDFGLLGSQGELVAVIIVDAPAELDVDSVDSSLYVSDSDGPLVIHTNGLTWRFILSLPPKGISCDKAFVVSIDGPSAGERFVLLMSQENLQAGHAHTVLAGFLAQKPAEMSVLMATWIALLGTDDSSIPTLLADKVEARTGNRPSIEDVSAFFRVPEKSATDHDIVDKAAMIEVLPSAVSPATVRDFKVEERNIKRTEENPALPQLEESWYRIGDMRVNVKNGRAVVLGILRYLEAQSPGFLERCAAHPENVGNTRKYIADTPDKLYPERPDFAAIPHMYAEIIPGWFLMTNFGTSGKIKIIKLAAAVSGLRHGQDIDYNKKR